MNRQKGHCYYDEDMSSCSKVVVVAVKASKDISRTALVWALTHVVQPGDCIKLLVIIPAISSSILHSLFFSLNSILCLQFHMLLITLRKQKI